MIPIFGTISEKTDLFPASEFNTSKHFDASGYKFIATMSKYIEL